MDVSIILNYGIEASDPRNGHLKDYALRIGERASLVPCENERVYGIMMTVDKDAVQDLYAEASVADYIPEEVSIILKSGMPVNAICYNLPPGSIKGTNASYARSLFKLTEQLGFPDAYLEKIKKLANTAPGKK